MENNRAHQLYSVVVVFALSPMSKIRQRTAYHGQALRQEYIATFVLYPIFLATGEHLLRFLKFGFQNQVSIPLSLFLI